MAESCSGAGRVVIVKGGGFMYRCPVCSQLLDARDSPPPKAPHAVVPVHQPRRMARG